MKRVLQLLLALVILFSCAALAEESTAPAKTIENAVEQFLHAEMSRLANAAEEGWQKFIYQQGAHNIQMDLEKFDIEKGKPLSVSFQLASGQPSLKKQPKYEGDPEPWIAGVVEAMSTPNITVKTSLLITETNGSYAAAYAPKAEASLKKSVKDISGKAAKAFQNKTILAALIDYLMPVPIAIPKKAPANLANVEYRDAFLCYDERNSINLDQHRYAPALLYGLKNHKLDCSGGPDALVLTYSHIEDLMGLIGAASNTLGIDLAYDENAKKYTEQEITNLLVSQVEKDVIAFRHGKQKGIISNYSFSILSLPEALAPEALYDLSYDSLTAYTQDSLKAVLDTVEQFPDYPAIPTPKTGVVTGGKKGSRVVFKAPKDGFLRAIVVYDSNGKIINISLLNPGTKLTMFLPAHSSEYQAVSCVGKVWYGPEHLFGENASYRDDTVETRYKSTKKTETEVITTTYFWEYTYPEIDAETYALLQLFSKPLSEVIPSQP